MADLHRQDQQDHQAKIRDGHRPALRGRDFVTPEDVKAVAYDVLRHRVSLTYEAEAENLTSEKIVQRILERIEVP